MVVLKQIFTSSIFSQGGQASFTIVRFLFAVIVTQKKFCTTCKYLTSLPDMASGF